jgi:hypothetical protein
VTTCAILGVVIGVMIGVPILIVLGAVIWWWLLSWPHPRPSVRLRGSTNEEPIQQTGRAREEGAKRAFASGHRALESDRRVAEEEQRHAAMIAKTEELRKLPLAREAAEAAAKKLGEKTKP